MAKTKSVTVYKTRTCPWCHKTMEWLNEHHVKFTEKDVGEDSKAAAEMVKKSGQRGVPVIDINGEIVVGYDPERFKKLLGVKD